MKSYINTLFDYHNVPIEKEITISCPREHLERKLKALTRKNKQTVMADTVEKGDIVVLSLESGLAKFNKPTVFITVGSGLFDSGFEEGLIGRSLESFETNVNGNTVQVTVKQISRTVFPEPTDEMVQAYAKEHEELDGIATVEEYKNDVIHSYLEEAKQNVFYEKVEEVLDYILTHSDFEFDENEVHSIIEQDIAYINEELSSQGKTFEALTDEDAKRLYQVNSVDEMKELMRITAEREIATILVTAYMKGIDVKDKAIEDFEYYSFEFIEEYLRETLTIKEEG